MGDNMNEEIRQYFNILCDGDYPEFIDKYLEVNELKRLSHIGFFVARIILI